MNDSTDEPIDESSPRRMALAAAIRSTRGEMRQVEFAKRVGRPQSVVSNWETGDRVPGLETLCRAEEGLGLPYGTIAARAGYFAPEAITGLAPEGIAQQVHDTFEAATAVVAAADLLGLTSRLDSEPKVGGRVWRVTVSRDVAPVPLTVVPE